MEVLRLGCGQRLAASRPAVRKSTASGTGGAARMRRPLRATERPAGKSGSDSDLPEEDVDVVLNFYHLPRRGPGAAGKAAAEADAAQTGRPGGSAEGGEVVYSAAGQAGRPAATPEDVQLAGEVAAEDAQAGLERTAAAAAQAADEVQADLSAGVDAAIDDATAGLDSVASAAGRASEAVQADLSTAADAAIDDAAAGLDSVASAAGRAAEAMQADLAEAAGVVELAATDALQQGAEAMAAGAQAAIDAASATAAAVLQPLQQPAAGAGNGAGPLPPLLAGGVDALKSTLMSMLASMDRGLAASDDQARRIDTMARQLQAAGGSVVLSWLRPEGGGSAGRPTLAQLDGRWRLVYSSGFRSGSLGGRRPGPPAGLLPLTLGQVFQDIRTDASTLDNVVELTAAFSLAALPGVNAAPPAATARLRHRFEVVGASTVRITFESTEVRVGGGLGGWLDNLPTLALPQLPEALQPPSGLRSADFEVVFLDEEMRVTRGDRGELRIFLKGAT